MAAKIETRAAPVGGINARDAIAAMPETDAIDLINWVPDTFGVRTRKGYREWAINFPDNAPVKSLMSWMGPATAFPGGTFLDVPTELPGFMFAATDDGIYDITVTTDAPVLSRALSGADGCGWLSSVALANSGGTFLAVVSETDGYFYFNGVAWTTPTFGTGPGQFGGINPSAVAFVTSWKRRLWFIERNSTSAWYLPVDSITGVATEYDFGPLFKRGGSLAYIANWTIDAGEGIDDFMVVASSNGDIVVYKGTDPASSSTFQAVGTWSVGQIPEGRRAFAQYGGDLVILSADGINPVSFVTRGGSGILQATGQEYSSKIRAPLGQDLRASFTTKGWQLLFHPTERLLLCSIPDYGGYRSRQYAMSTTLNSWCQFQNIPVLCYGSSGGYVLSGTNDGRVLLLFSGYFDNIPYGENTGDGIAGVVQPAFSYLGSPAMQKLFTMLRPNFLAVDVPSVVSGVSVDFEVQNPTGVSSFPVGTAGLWDVTKWDSAIWGGKKLSYAEWVTVGGLGFSGAASLMTTCVADTVLVSIDYMFEAGWQF